MRIMSSTSPGSGGGGGDSSANVGGEAPARTFANESRAFRGLFARLAWPVLAFVSYYIGMFSLRGSTAMASAFAHSAVLWSVELETLVTTVGYNYRNMAFYTEPAWNAAFTAKLKAQTSTLASVAEDLVYGSSARGLQSLVATSPSTYQYMLKNGCVQNGVSAAQCAVYGPSPYYGCNAFVRTSCRPNLGFV